MFLSQNHPTNPTSIITMSETNVQGEAMPSVNAVNVLSPLGPHDQFLSQNLRCQVALGFRHIIGDIRLAHKYAVIGWTGTLDQASNSHAHRPHPIPPLLLLSSSQNHKFSSRRLFCT